MSMREHSKLQWAETIATVGVLVSLVFVGLELRQNTAVARAQARNDLAMLAQDWLLVLGQDPTANRAWRAYWYDDDQGPLSAVDESQAYYLMIALVRRLEATYFHHQEGLIPQEALKNYGMDSPVFDSPRFRTEFWPTVRNNFDPQFVSFFELVQGL
jgi:hypothetical protein